VSDELNRREALRAAFLRRLYEVSGGDTRGRIQMAEIGDELGLDRDETERIVDYLHDRGLAAWRAFGGMIGITPAGVDAAEAALREKAITGNARALPHTSAETKIPRAEPVRAVASAARAEFEKRGRVPRGEAEPPHADVVQPARGGRRMASVDRFAGRLVRGLPRLVLFVLSAAAAAIIGAVATAYTQHWLPGQADNGERSSGQSPTPSRRPPTARAAAICSLAVDAGSDGFIYVDVEGRLPSARTADVNSLAVQYDREDHWQVRKLRVRRDTWNVDWGWLSPPQDPLNSTFTFVLLRQTNAAGKLPAVGTDVSTLPFGFERAGDEVTVTRSDLLANDVIAFDC
jgi:hypothetical protein